MDASYGVTLRGEGALRFDPVGTRQSGFGINGQARGIRLIQNESWGTLLAVTRNNDHVQLFRAER